MKRIFYLLSMLLLISCEESKNSEAFISTTQGRYLYNSDEIITVDYEDGIMNLTFRGQKIHPLKVNDSSFFVKEFNVKYIFVSQPEMHIEYTPLSEIDKTFRMKKMASLEKTPREYFEDKNYEKAKEAYLLLQKNDSLDETIQEWKLNTRGYDYKKAGQMEEAREMFEINIALYPKSSNTYDSMGDFYKDIKDTIKAIEYYKKALVINPEKRSSKRQLERLTKE